MTNYCENGPELESWTMHWKSLHFHFHKPSACITLVWMTDHAKVLQNHSLLPGSKEGGPDFKIDLGLGSDLTSRLDTVSSSPPYMDREDATDCPLSRSWHRMLPGTPLGASSTSCWLSNKLVLTDFSKLLISSISETISGESTDR